MPSFYFIVIAISVVFLILCLTLVGLLMSYQGGSVPFPPTANMCPDNWSVDSTGVNCIVPKGNAPNNGTLNGTDNGYASFLSNTNALMAFNNATQSLDSYTNINPNKVVDTFKTDLSGGKVSINFNDPNWGGICGKQKWSQMFNISWDGVSNYNKC
jgi:hypothetical protein